MVCGAYELKTYSKTATAPDISSSLFSLKREKSLIILVAQNDILHQFDF